MLRRQRDARDEAGHDNTAATDATTNDHPDPAALSQKAVELDDVF
jgi:hypothetical protein